MAAKALLAANPKPTNAEVDAALAGNLCRCTGYQKIVEAVQWAAGTLRGEDARPPREAFYGSPLPVLAQR
jgi:xanthine dehydrogenase iron-sulfur cluster and FAD-binding subunit A